MSSKPIFLHFLGKKWPVSLNLFRISLAVDNFMLNLLAAFDRGKPFSMTVWKFGKLAKQSSKLLHRQWNFNLSPFLKPLS
jgi:hypothetical protein